MMCTITSVWQLRPSKFVQYHPHGEHASYATGQAPDVASPYGHHVAHLAAGRLLYVFSHVSGMATAYDHRLRQPNQSRRVNKGSANFST